LTASFTTAVVVVTEGESFRLREARSKGGERQKK